MKIKMNLGVIIFLIMGICLQIFLSKKDNKLLGLILPIITFLNSVLCLLQSFTFIMGVKAFIITNIPTVILLSIYLICRNNKKKCN